MPDIKVVFRNIENFGKHNHAIYQNNQLHRCIFIAQAILNMDADVIMVQEFIQGGQPALDLLPAGLNSQPGQDWYYADSRPC